MNVTRTYTHYILTTGVFVILFVLVSLMQYAYDSIVHPKGVVFQTETRYVMPPSIVKKLSFGFNNVLADFYWVNIIQDFSIWNGRDTFYLDEYRNVATLDPKFSFPYLLGILTFASREINYKETAGVYKTDVDTFEPIVALGMKNIPDSWEIPFYMGTAYQLTKSPDKALAYLKIASENSSAPERVRNAYKTYLKNVLTGKNIGTDLVKTIYETTSNKTTKKIIQDGILAKTLEDILQGIVNDFRKRFGYYPSSLNDLATHKMINLVPELQHDYSITIERGSGIVTVKTKSN